MTNENFGEKSSIRLNMMDVRKWLREYMKERIHVRVPVIPYIPSSEPAFSPSSAGFCAKARWMENKDGIIPTHPMTLREEMADSQRKDDGSRNQERFQEVFLWAAAAGKLTGLVSIEQPLSYNFYDPYTDTYKLVRGRADVIVNTGNAVHIIEVKRRDTFMGKLQPKQSDIDQLSMYRNIMLNFVPMPVYVNTYLIISEREYYEMWHIQTFTTETAAIRVRATSEHGEVVEYDFKMPVDIINENTWLPTKAYPEVPITDYLNHPQGWMCAKQYPKPKTRKTKNENGDFFTPGKAKVNCPFFGHCHGASAKRFATGLVDGRIVRLSDLPDEEDENEADV